MLLKYNETLADLEPIKALTAHSNSLPAHLFHEQLQLDESQIPRVARSAGTNQIDTGANQIDAGANQKFSDSIKSLRDPSSLETAEVLENEAHLAAQAASQLHRLQPRGTHS